MEKLAARAKKMVAGDPMDPKTRYGALASKKQLETRRSATSTSRRRKGRRSSPAASRADIGTGKGYFFQPTVFDDVTPEMTIAREEIFGPVLAAIEFADLDEAIARANDSPYGLAAAVWTRDIKKAHYVAPQAPGRHRLDQHLQRLRHGRAVRRLQGERLRPRDERARARALHAGQERVGRPEHVAAPSDQSPTPTSTSSRST